VLVGCLALWSLSFFSQFCPTPPFFTAIFSEICPIFVEFRPASPFFTAIFSEKTAIFVEFCPTSPYFQPIFSEIRRKKGKIWTFFAPF
jgi:hypothetical protein